MQPTKIKLAKTIIVSMKALWKRLPRTVESVELSNGGSSGREEAEIGNGRLSQELKLQHTNGEHFRGAFVIVRVGMELAYVTGELLLP